MGIMMRDKTKWTRVRDGNIVIDRYDPEGWFFASVPGVKGLVSFGRTEEETLDRLRVAFNLMKERGAVDVQIKAID